MTYSEKINIFRYFAFKGWLHLHQEIETDLLPTLKKYLPSLNSKCFQIKLLNLDKNNIY